MIFRKFACRARCKCRSFAVLKPLPRFIIWFRPSWAVCERDYGAIDVLAAAFPGGSVTGAPKVRAMEIITEMEGHARGPYCGAIGYIGFDGTMDTNIVIRTASFRGGSCVVQAGGGIVTASDPASEYDETLDKARAIFKAFGAKEFAK